MPSRLRSPVRALSRVRSLRVVVASFSLVALVTAVGCTPARTYVLQQPVKDFPRVQSVALRPEPATVEVSPEVQKTVDKAFAHNLEKKYGIALADYAPLEVHYRLVNYTPGNVFFRIISNVANIFGSPFYGIGDGTVAVEVRFVQPGGRELGSIVSDGPISGAFGNTSDAAGTAAHNVSDFVNQNYAALPPGAEPAPSPTPNANTAQPAADREVPAESTQAAPQQDTAQADPASAHSAAPVTIAPLPPAPAQ